MAKSKSDSEFPRTSRKIICESTEKLEYANFDIPKESENEVQVQLDKEKIWLEEMIERTERAKAGPEVYFSLGQYYYLRQDYENAIIYFEVAAGLPGSKRTGDDGYDLQASYQLGVIYYDGLGVTPDAEKGSKFMLKVAQSEEIKSIGHMISSAQYNMGRAHFMGFGVNQSDQKAEEWWILAAEQGSDPSSIRAKHILGLYYSRPDSFDINKSFKWHKGAAEDGHSESMAAVGLLYDLGGGCSVDRAQALNWLRRSSQCGSIYGTGLLARHYYERKMFLRASETALRVSEMDQQGPAQVPDQQADHQEGESSGALSHMDFTGVALSCFILARCLETGLGMEMSIDKAKHYYDKATLYDKKTTAKLHTARVLGSL